MAEIGKIKENIYKEGSPVVIKQASLNSEEEKIFAKLVFKNISNNNISSVLVDIHVFDRANIEIEVVRDFLYILDEAMPRDSLFGCETEIEVVNENAKSFSVAIRRVCFDNETVWAGSNSILFETLPEPKTLEEELEEKETVEQYQRDFKNGFAKNSEIEVKYVPLEYKDVWICSCGELNTKEDESCFVCGAEYLTQKTHIDNRVLLATNLYEYKKAIKEEAERQRQEALRIAEEERLAKAEKERLEAEERALEEARIKRKKKIRIITISITVPLVLLIVTYIYLLNVFIIPQNNYKDAIALLDEEEYDSAIIAFQELNGYSESEKYIIEANYQKAKSLMTVGDYEQAIEIFQSIEKSKDVENDIKESKYQMALIKYNDKKYEDAVEIFKEIEDYFDSADKIQSSYFEITKAFVLEYDLNSAIPYFEKLNEENTVAVQALFLENGKTLYNLGDKEEAEIYFALINEANLVNEVKKVYYDYAVSLIEEKSYDEAIEVLNQVIDYEDSKELVNECEYLKAEELFAQKKYTEAIEQYKAVEDYKDAKDKIKECNYLLAGTLLKDKKYDEAIEAYKALDGYKDSKEVLTQIIYDYGVALFKKGEYLDSYNMLYQIKDNSDAYYMLVTKSPYYKYVYDRGLGVKP